MGVQILKNLVLKFIFRLNQYCPDVAVLRFQILYLHQQLNLLSEGLIDFRLFFSELLHNFFHLETVARNNCLIVFLLFVS